MKIYYSALRDNLKQYKSLLPFSIGILESYYGMSEIKVPEYCDSYFLDSGAFSAFNNDISIDVNNYIDFVKKNLDKIDVTANLDDISSGEISRLNYVKMLDSGLNILPVYHMGEPLQLLDFYLDHTDYVGLGGVVKAHKEQMVYFLDKIFTKYPTSKFHGFGVKVRDLLKRYPWYSVDSSSPMVIARYGGICTPWGDLKINLSVRSEYLKWMTPLTLDRVKRWVMDDLGIDFDFASQNTTDAIRVRYVISIMYFEDFNKKYCSRINTKKIKKSFGLEKEII